MKKVFFAALALTALSSCQRNGFDEAGPLKEVAVRFTLPSTKVGLSDDHTKWRWSDGDAVSIFNDFDRTVAKAEPGDGSAPCVVKTPYQATKLYGLSPYSAACEEGPSRIGVTIPVEQTQTLAGKTDGLPFPMAGTCEVAADGASSLSLFPLVSSIALNIFRSVDADPEEKILSVKLMPLAVSGFAGSGVVDLTAATPAFSAGDSSQPIVLTPGVPVDIASAKPEPARSYAGQLYAVLARQKYVGIALDIITTKGKISISAPSAVFDCTAYDFVVANVDLSGKSVELDLEASIDSFSVLTGDDKMNGAIDDAILVDIGTLTEDIIPDFSRVGYKYGDVEPPVLPVAATISMETVEANVGPGKAFADTSSYFQSVIDGVMDSGGGAVLVKEGTYHLSRTLFIDKDNTVLRGEGPDKTILYGDGPRIAWVMVGIGVSKKAVTNPSTEMLWNGRVVVISSWPATGYNKPFGTWLFYEVNPRNNSWTYGKSTAIIDEYVPVGRLFVEVHDAGIFNVGDQVAIQRVHSNEWISDIGMDKIASNGPTREAAGSPVSQWNTENWNKYWYRTVTAVNGNRVYLDAPVVQSLDRNYGGGYLIKVTREYVSGCGVEHIGFDSGFDSSITYQATLAGGAGKVTTYPDEEHTWQAVQLLSAQHCWVRDVVTKHMGHGCVEFASGSRLCTVDNCHTTEPASYVSGNRRYAFIFGNGSSQNLVKNCTTDLDRHSFAFSVNNGPNVFYNCTATRSFDGPEPHQRWCTGGLFDNVTCLNTHLYIRDRGNSGNGHGWAGANYVIWNCRAYTIECSNPWSRLNTPQLETMPGGYVFHSPHPSGQNWCIGSIGKKLRGSTNYNSPYFSSDPPQTDYYKDVLGFEYRPDGYWYPEREKNSMGSEADRIDLNNVPSEAAAKNWWPRLTSGAVFSNPESLYLSQLQDRHERGVFLQGL